MTSSSQYREFAEECLRLAKQAPDEHHRKILKEMAEALADLIRISELALWANR